MQDEKTNEDSQERTEVSNGSTRAAKILEERMHKRRRRASTARLISYIIALIGVLLLIFWLRRGL